MDTTLLSIEDWLRQEMDYINEAMKDSINGKLKGRLYSCDEKNQEIVLEYPLEDWQVNGLGTLHGGISSAMMDLTMSVAVYCYSRQSIPPTISMTVNYLRPIPMEGNVLVKARVTSIGRKNATAYCEAIIPGSGKLGCTALGTYAVIPKG